MERLDTALRKVFEYTHMCAAGSPCLWSILIGPVLPVLVSFGCPRTVSAYSGCSWNGGGNASGVR